MLQPVVSVAMMTYFHEKYISRAIDSVLAQETGYTFEIVISDDCSTDRTRDILLDYQNKYPKIIRLNFNAENIGISANHYKTRSLCRGEFIADIAGDDYWIDKRKLQKQVDFLKQHNDYVATVTCVEVRLENSEKAIEILPKKFLRGGDISLEMYLHGIPLSTHGLVTRNYYLTKEGRKEFLLIPKASRYIDDSTECLLLLRKGNVRVMDFTSCVYRVQSSINGKRNYNSLNTVLTHTYKMIELYNTLGKYLSLNYSYLYRINVARALLYCIIKRNIHEINIVVSQIPPQYQRMIIFKSIPFALRFGFDSIRRKINRKLTE